MSLKRLLARTAVLAAASVALVTGAAAQSGEPIKIGFSMAMTGGLGGNGKSALLAQKIWEEDVNAKGGLLGRPVKLIYYDDQSNPSTVPGIYTKLLDVDKVDIVMGGAMVGPQNTSMKAQLGPLLNGFVNYEFWLPVPKMQFAGVDELIKKYQSRAASEGVDPLGYYMAPQAYAQFQVLAQAITATKTLNDDKLADYIRTNTFKTVLGDVKFGKGGEWAEGRVLQVQFQNIKGNDVGQFKDISTQVVVSPPELASGNLVYPYEKAK